MNTKGTKFLAVLAVLAMAFAAFAVVNSVEETDAADISAEALVDSTTAIANGDTVTAGKLLASDNITIIAATGIEPTLYILDGKTVTITGAATAGAITVYAAKTGSTAGVDSTTAMANDACIVVTPSTAGDSVSIKAVYGVSETSASNFQVSGTVTNLAFTAATGGAAGDAPHNTMGVIKDSTLVVAGDKTGLGVYKAAYYYHAAATTQTTFYATQPTSVAIAENDVFYPIASGVTISTGSNTVVINDIGETKYAEALSFSGYVETEVLKLQATGTLAAGEVKVTLGSLKLVGAQTNTWGTKLITGVKGTDATIGAGAIVSADVTGTDAAFILGDYSFPNKNTKLDANVTVAEGAVLTIPANATVNVGVNKSADVAGDVAFNRTLTVAGKLDVWGKLIGVSGKNSHDPAVAVTPALAVTGGMSIRAGAQVSGFVDATGADTITGENLIEEIPAAEKYTFISGNVENDATYTNVALSDTLTVLAGKTLTITGMLALNGHALEVEGTLVIAEGAQVGGKGLAAVGANAIILGTAGKITNNGIIAKNAPVYIGNATSGVMVEGVSGMTLGIAKVSTNYFASVSGTVAVMENSNISRIQLDNAYINADATISEGVVANLTANNTVVSKGTFTMAGVLALPDDGNLVLKAGTALDVAGYVIAPDDGVILAESTLLGGDKTKTGTIVVGESATFKPTLPTASDASTHYATGYKISVVKTTYMTEDEEPVEMYYQRAYIEGALNFTPALVGEATLTAAGGLTITNEVFIAADKQFSQPYANMKIAGAGKVVVEGKLVSAAELPTVIGAVYDITTTGDVPVTTHYAVDINTGLAGIDGFKNKTVTLYANLNYPVTLAADLTILDKQIVESNDVAALIIPEGVTLTVNKGGSFDGAVIGTLEGKVVVLNDGNCDLSPLLYQVYFENDAGDATYCGLETALAEAQPGDIITVANNIAGKTTFTVPAGVTVVIDTGKTLTVEKNITVSAGATLEVNGSLVFGTDETKNAKINVIGIMDVSAAQGVTLNNYDGDASYAMQIVAEGEFIYTAAIPAGIVQVGVTYKDGTKTILTTIANAIESGKDMTIPGTYTTEESIALGTAKLTVTGTATIASIDATGGSIDASAGKLTATVTGVSGASDAVSIVLDGFQGVITDKSAADKYTVAITTLEKGSVKIVAGTVVLKDVDTKVEAKKTFEVATGATLEIADAGIGIANSGNLVIAGKLIVDKDGAALTIANAGDEVTTISGQVEVAAGGALTLAKATVSGSMDIKGGLTITNEIALTGSIVIDNSEESVADAVVNGNITVGSSTLGAAASLTGKKITLNNDNYVAVYPGATIDATVLKGYKATEFYLNDVLYVTAYGTDACTVADVAADGVISAVVKVAGSDMTGMDDATKWKDAAGAALTAATTVGEKAKVYFSGVQLTCQVVVSSTTGTSIFVDGVKYDSGKTLEGISVGKHTITVSINPGYKGTTTTTFNGKAVTDSFEVTSDMVGPTAKYVLSVTGDIVIDDGSDDKPADAGLGLTEILLIVLVILIAIMVVVLLIKLNRS